MASDQWAMRLTSAGRDLQEIYFEFRRPAGNVIDGSGHGESHTKGIPTFGESQTCHGQLRAIFSEPFSVDWSLLDPPRPRAGSETAPSNHSTTSKACLAQRQASCWHSLPCWLLHRCVVGRSLFFRNWFPRLDRAVFYFVSHAFANVCSSRSCLLSHAWFILISSFSSLLLSVCA